MDSNHSLIQQKAMVLLSAQNIDLCIKYLIQVAFLRLSLSFALFTWLNLLYNSNRRRLGSVSEVNGENSIIEERGIDESSIIRQGEYR